MLDYLQVFLNAVDGRIIKPAILTNAKMTENVICQCKCGRQFTRKLGAILVRGQWCRHTGANGDGDSVHYDIPLRLVYAFCAYIVSNAYEVRNTFYTIDSSKLTVAYLGPDTSPDSVDRSRERTVIDIPYRLIKDEGVAALKVVLLESLLQNNVRFASGLSPDIFKSMFSQFNFIIVRLVWNYQDPDVPAISVSPSSPKMDTVTRVAVSELASPRKQPKKNVPVETPESSFDELFDTHLIATPEDDDLSQLGI